MIEEITGIKEGTALTIAIAIAMRSIGEMMRVKTLVIMLIIGEATRISRNCIRFTRE